jgi:hypothetical protein
MAATPVLLRVIPPQIDLSENIQPKALIAHSPQQVRCVQYPSTSFSQSNAVFNIIPVSPEIVLARYILMTLPMTITIQSTVKNGKSPAYAFNSQFAGLCQFPLHQNMSTLTLGLNNSSITIRPTQIFPALLQYWIDREQQTSVMSTTPCYPDQTNTSGQLDGEITSEFADYASSVDHISRNCNATMNFTQNDQLQADGASGTAVINVTVSEPLMISPLVFSDMWHRRAGITQINNVNIQITYDPQTLQNRLLRQSPNDYVNWTSINVQLGQPSVALWYYTMPSYMKIPETISYPYAQITNFV